MKTIGRNDPCGCGSGRKYKHCCLAKGRTAAAGAVRQAKQHYQAGQHEHAEALVRQALEADPGHPEALLLLGVMALQAGNHHAALELIGKSLER